MKRMTQNRKKSMKQNTRKMKKRGGTQKNQRRNKRNTTKKNRVRNNKKRGGKFPRLCSGSGCSISAVKNQPSTRQNNNNNDNNKLPPSTSLGATTPSASESSPATSPELNKYIMMLKVGAGDATAVAIKMFQEKKSIIDVNKVVGNKLSEDEIQNIQSGLSTKPLRIKKKQEKKSVIEKKDTNFLTQMIQAQQRRGIFVPNNNTTKNDSSNEKNTKSPNKISVPNGARPKLPFAGNIPGKSPSFLEQLKKPKQLKKPPPPRPNTGANTGAKAGAPLNPPSFANQAKGQLQNLKKTGKELW
jgi:hypothetical protein